MMTFFARKNILPKKCGGFREKTSPELTFSKKSGVHTEFFLDKNKKGVLNKKCSRGSVDFFGEKVLDEIFSPETMGFFEGSIFSCNKKSFQTQFGEFTNVKFASCQPCTGVPDRKGQDFL